MKSSVLIFFFANLGSQICMGKKGFSATLNRLSVLKLFQLSNGGFSLFVTYLATGRPLASTNSVFSA